MASPTPQATPEAIADIYKDAQEVLRISEERFNVGEQIEALDTEDPQVIAMLDALGKLSTPNLARLSTGKPIVSYGAEYGAGGEDPKVVKSFLSEKRRIVQEEGRSFTAAELAGLAIPMYLARKDEAAEDAAGSEPVQVRRYSTALRGAITTPGREDETLSVYRPVEGTVDHADTKSGVFEVIPDPDSSEAGTVYQVEPVKTTGVNAGQVQVHIQAA